MLQLAMRQLDDLLTVAEHRELETLLREDRHARAAYVQYFQDTACLRWLCLEEMSESLEPMKSLPASYAKKSQREWHRIVVWGGVACVLLAGSIATLAFQKRSFKNLSHATSQVESKVAPQAAPVASRPVRVGTPIEHAREVATVTGLGVVKWLQPAAGARMLSRWAVGDRMRLGDGAVELTFDAGAQVTILGPADFVITSATSIRCQTGRVTAVVGERGKGFVVETPRAKVVDLGTQFGLAISEKGETEVVVFQGSVDLSDSPVAGSKDITTRRLEQGEAILVNNSGQFQRVVSVQRNDFLAALDAPRRRVAAALIGDVQDNIRPTEGVKSYQIVRGGLEDDAPCFVDRSHQWNGLDGSGLPEFLVGADYVMPFNDDKFIGTLEIKLRLLRPATLYVFLDNNMAVPDWIRRDFEDTGIDIGLDGGTTEWHPNHALGTGGGKSVDFPFSVWRREVKQAGTVRLGSVQPPVIGTRSAGFNMYGIAAVATK